MFSYFPLFFDEKYKKTIVLQILFIVPIVTTIGIVLMYIIKIIQKILAFLGYRQESQSQFILDYSFSF